MGNSSARVFPEGVTATFELVTPEIAKQWLELNENNRHFSKKLVELYSAAMREDLWLVNGEAIQFSREGRLLNGQHRLSSIIDAGVSLWLLVLRGLPEEAQATMDAGRKRTAGDVLSLLGYSNYHTLASAARLALHLSHPSLPRQFTNSQVVSFVEQHPDLVEAAQAAVPLTSIPLSSSPRIYTYWRIVGGSPEEGEAFFHALATLANLDEDNPALTLHKRLVSYESAGAGDGWTRREEVVALVFRAWNAWVEGKPQQVLRIPRSQGRVVIPEVMTAR